ncbi:MAG: helicase-related protein, partial [Bacillota bacterium]
NWLIGGDHDARRLRRILMDWVEHRVLIFSSALGESDEERLKLRASTESFDFLYMLDPVVGVVGGGSRGNIRPIQQFNTPGLPYVMVGTDTIREGVNLHLFCDRVMHFGVAWTAGDLEQRVGRVDRYFSRIERRLREGAEGRAETAHLDVIFPYLRDTLERQQIDVILERKRQSEAVVDSDFVEQGDAKADGLIQIDMVRPVVKSQRRDESKAPFPAEKHLPRKGR